MLGLDAKCWCASLSATTRPVRASRRLIKREVGARKRVLVSLLVLLETEWVLRSRYGLAKAKIMDAISGLLDATELELEGEPTIEEVLCLWKNSGPDFAGYLIGAHHRRLGCRATAIFDPRAVKLPGFVAG